jgi:hypothetical protein
LDYGGGGGNPQKIPKFWISQNWGEKRGIFFLKNPENPRGKWGWGRVRKRTLNQNKMNKKN